MLRTMLSRVGQRLGLGAVLLLALGAWEPMRTEDEDVARGNQAFADKDWDAAIEAYEAARGSLQQGFKGTFEQLDAYLAEARG